MLLVPLRPSLPLETTDAWAASWAVAVSENETTQNQKNYDSINTAIVVAIAFSILLSVAP